MPNEGFLRRWSRLKAGEPGAAPHEPGPARQDRAAVAPHPAAAALQPAPPALQPAPAALLPVAQVEPHPAVPFPPPQLRQAQGLPTLDDVATLGTDSDFSAFVTRGVDKAVQRLAMKKLFADPHFRLSDGLDVYIDDYTRPDPVSAAMLASLDHARSALSRALDDEPPKGDAAPPDGGQDPLGNTDQPPGGTQPPSPQGNA